MFFSLNADNEITVSKEKVIGEAALDPKGEKRRKAKQWLLSVPKVSSPSWLSVISFAARAR